MLKIYLQVQVWFQYNSCVGSRFSKMFDEYEIKISIQLLCRFETGKGVFTIYNDMISIQLLCRFELSCFVSCISTIDGFLRVIKA